VTSELERRAAIEALVFAYAERLDAGDLAGVGALFEVGSFGAEAGPLVSGAASVERLLRDFVILHEDGTPRTKHVTTNLVIEADEDGDDVTARSYFTVFQALPGEEPRAIALGRYRDRFTRGPGGWCFAERRAAVDLAGDLSRHLRRRTS
jgi:3-phenylpropionate/cinnamic acid dioxygenase small subunit